MIEAVLSKIAETSMHEIGKEGLKKSSENLPNFAKDIKLDNIKSFEDADRPINKIQNTLDDTKTYLSDKILTSVYEVKGVWNDYESHQFYDAKGSPLEKKMKISDMLGERSVKMPYEGSDKSNTNSAGYLRDNKYFWSEYKTKYADTLSQNNTNLIDNGKSPIVDKKWIENNPNQKSFLGEKLEHHHRNNTDETFGVPQTLHRGRFNKEKMHVD